MTSEAEYILTLANTFGKEYSSGRTSGRDHNLVYLAKMVEIITNRQHYEELSSLVQAVRWGYDPGCKKEDTAETIRDLVSRNQPVDLVFESKLEKLRQPRANPTPEDK